MNNWNGIGRLVSDAELRFTPGDGKPVCGFTIALDDGYGDKKKTYYIKINAWNKTAENVANYTHKGSLVGISGKIITRSYDNKEGKKVYVTEILANEVKFLEPKGTGQTQNNEYSAPADVFGGGSFDEEITPVDDDSDSMPF